jgi:L-alanine-DL-glutamate epimerase-like enolase superfamily enzyme
VLRVDGNQGYSLEDARVLLRTTDDLDIEMLEQPLNASDLDGMSALRGESRVPIVADEAAGTIDECEKIVERSAAHGINIKLMKCGGPSAARTIHDRAHADGLSLMLGCNDETRISIAAAAHLALAMPGLKYADLDGHMDLVRDPASGGFEMRDGCLHVSEQPGLGVEVSL